MDDGLNETVSSAEILEDRGAAVPTMAAYALRPVLSAARELGFDVNGTLRAHDVAPELFDLMDARLDAPTVISLLAELEAHPLVEGQEPLALVAARHAELGAFGIFDCLISTTSTLREAIEISHRYHSLISDCDSRLLIEDGSVARHRVVVNERRYLSPLLAEYALGVMMLHGWALMGRERLSSEVRIAHSCRGNARAYQEFFRTPVVFDATDYEVVFPRAYLDLPLPRANPQVRDVLAERASALLGQERATTSFVDKVRASLRVALDEGDGSVKGVAKRLDTSGRTLQRRLKDHGTTFEELLDGLRRDLATTLIASAPVPIVSVARKLGFTDASAFARAFRRWTTMSPTEYRAAVARRA